MPSSKNDALVAGFDPVATLAENESRLAALLLLFESLGSAHRAARETVAEAASRHGLSESEFHLLWACHQRREQPPSQNDLAQTLGLSPAQVSCLVEQLRKQDWIAGTRAALDRRKQVWRLTDTGISTLSAAAETVRQATDHLPRRYSRAAIDELLTTLRGLAEAINDGAGERKEAA